MCEKCKGLEKKEIHNNRNTTSNSILVGEKYGEWEVIETGIIDKNGKNCSRIRCSCGRDEKIRLNSRIKDSNSCVKCARESEATVLKINDKFGKWKVLEVGLRNDKGQYCSKVICDCGRTTKIIENSSLKTGKTTQCIKCSNHVTDLNIGDEFGKWKVVEIGLKLDKSNASMCSCECGRTTTLISNSHLIKGKTTQCPICARGRIDLTKGEVHGSWTIVEPNISNHGTWSSKCVCICGSERIIKNTSLVNNDIGRCNNCVDMTTKEYKIAIQKSSGNITLADGEKYKGKYVKIKHICGECLEEWSVTPITILNGQKYCGKCRDKITQSFMATALQQVLKLYYPNTMCEHDIGFKGDAGKPSKYDVFVEELNLIIECQSGYHDGKEDFDKRKRKYAEDLGYEFSTIDSREFSPLEACKIFFPDFTIEEMNAIVDWSKCSRRQWDVEEAQQLLNNGKTMMEVADSLENCSYMAIIDAISREQLIKPLDYKTKTSLAIGVIQLDLDYNFIKEFRVASDTGHSRDIIHNACKGKSNFKQNSHYSSEFLWFYKEDYESLTDELKQEYNNINNIETKIEIDEETRVLYHSILEVNPNIKFKTCKCCGKLLPCDELYFSKQKDGLYGFTAQCKQCHNEHYKQAQELAECGVYKIINIINDKIYIGSASNIRISEQQYNNDLKNRSHPNRLLQEDIIEYGEANFKFEVIEIVKDKDNLLERCQFWLDKFKSYDSDLGYNISPTVGSCLGIKKTIEQREQMSITHTGRVTSEETKEKLRITSTGKFHTDATKEKLRLINTGKTISEETKTKISMSLKGRATWNKGGTASEEAKDKMSKSAMGKHNGSKNPLSVLTENDVIIIKILLSLEIKGTEISKLFPIKKATISSIKHNRNWSYLHLEDFNEEKINSIIIEYNNKNTKLNKYFSDYKYVKVA